MIYHQFISMMSKKCIRVVKKITSEEDRDLCGSFYYDVLMFDIDINPSPTLNSILVKEHIALYETNGELEKFIRKDVSLDCNKITEQEDVVSDLDYF